MRPATHRRMRRTASMGTKGNQACPAPRNVLDEARDLVKKRLAELDDERQRLERALAELGGKADRRPASPGRPRNDANPPSKPTAPNRPRTAKKARRRRKRRGGTRADQAVKLIRAEPGHHRFGRSPRDENQAELPLPGPQRPRETETGQEERPQYYSAAERRYRTAEAGLGPASSDLRAGRAGDRVALLLELHRRWRRSARARSRGPRAPRRPTTRRPLQLHGSAGDDPLLDPVGAVGRDAHRDPVARPACRAPSRGRGRSPRWRPRRRWRRRAPR